MRRIAGIQNQGRKFLLPEALHDQVPCLVQQPLVYDDKRRPAALDQADCFVNRRRQLDTVPLAAQDDRQELAARTILVYE